MVNPDALCHPINQFPCHLDKIQSYRCKTLFLEIFEDISLAYELIK